MGTNTTNPPAMSVDDAMQKAEVAMANLHSLRGLMGAVAGCTFMIEPEALFLVRDSLADLAAAWEVLFPILCAATKGAEGKGAV